MSHWTTARMASMMLRALTAVVTTVVENLDSAVTALRSHQRNPNSQSNREKRRKGRGDQMLLLERMEKWRKESKMMPLQAVGAVQRSLEGRAADAVVSLMPAPSKPFRLSDKSRRRNKTMTPPSRAESTREIRNSPGQGGRVEEKVFLTL